MPNLCNELHFGRPQRVLFGEVDVGFEEPSLTVKFQNIKIMLKFIKKLIKKLLKSVGWSNEQDFPSINVTVIDESSRETLNRVLV